MDLPISEFPKKVSILKKEYAERCRINTYTNGIPTKFVDADSCPLKEEIVEIASTFSILLLLMIIMETIRLHMVMLHRKLIPEKKRRTYSL
ncbi:hypothetical protein V7075_16420 [Neobacillus drentensis]|uniref:hypothetical protein n=1 Tax=Neobacillus drentensis TaxID=220684 RepID=UPI002FFEAD80